MHIHHLTFMCIHILKIDACHAYPLFMILVYLDMHFTLFIFDFLSSKFLKALRYPHASSSYACLLLLLLL